MIHQSLVLPNESWSDQSSDTSLKLCKISSISSSSKQPLIVTICVLVNSDCQLSIYVHNHLVNQPCSAISSLPEKVSHDNFSDILKKIDSLGICAGQPDERFVQMGTERVLRSCNGSVVATVDDYAAVTVGEKVYTSTIRTTDCHLLVDMKCSPYCVSCSKYRNNLRAMYSRWSRHHQDQVTEISSHTNTRYLNSLEKTEKLRKLKKRAVDAEQKVKSLQRRITELTTNEGESLDSSLHGDLLSIMTENTEDIRKKFPEGSFRRLFWEEQLKAASQKDPRQMRWHPLIVRWCLNLKLMSSSSYHALRTAGFVQLPSERTLYDYSHFYESKAGFQVELNEQLMKESKVSELSESKKFCGIILDEMKVKENLVYNKHTGEVVGFINLGGINNDLLRMEDVCLQDQDCQPTVASHLLVLLVRGIFIKLNFPYAHFATDGVTADLLFPIVWEAVRQIECIGLKVIFVTADGASPNRKFFRMHKSSGPAITYKTRNRYAEDERYLYFFADPPHLVKTTRNCWSHSGWNGTRLMTVSN